MPDTFVLVVISMALIVASGPLGAPAAHPADSPIDTAMRSMAALIPAGAPAMPDALRAALGQLSEGGAGPSTQAQHSQPAQPRGVKSFDPSSLDALALLMTGPPTSLGIWATC